MKNYIGPSEIVERVQVEAIQFDPHTQPWPEEAVSWDNMPYRPRDMSWGYVETAKGKVHIQTGDWIVRYPSGVLRVYKPSTFEATFDPVEEEEKPAVKKPLMKRAVVNNSTFSVPNGEVSHD